jgi:hypothetical protein
MENNFYPMRGSQDLVQGLIDLCNVISMSLNRPTYELSICEIGSYTGESTEIFASRFRYVYAVDPWMDDYDPNDAACHHAPFSEVEKAFDQRILRYPNVQKVKGKSSDIIPKSNTKFDVVYIDGMHTYDAVKQDIIDCYSKVNFAIAGHDYNDDWQGVKKAVHEVLGQPDYVFKDSSWLKIL